MIDLSPRQRDGFAVRADVVTWDLYVFAVTGGEPDRTVFVSRRGADVGGFLHDLDAGRLDADLRRALARPPRRRLRRPPGRPSWPTPQVGVEHEYRILDRDDHQVDARTLLHDLGLQGVRADPSDPNAYRCPWGGVITCDGREVEVATPPVALLPGFVAEVVGSAAAGRRAVEDALPDGLRLAGYSTHLNVTAPRRGDDRRAQRLARTFAPAVMLALDRRDSPGLLVRPRPGRLELCGEHAEGDALAAVVALAAGAVLASGRRSARQLAVRAEVVPAVERYGWYVARTAFGPDLYVDGRSATLTAAGGRPRPAQEHLALAWRAADRALGDRAGPDDRLAIEAVVAGRRSLPCEPDAEERLERQPGTASKA